MSKEYDMKVRVVKAKSGGLKRLTITAHSPKAALTLDKYHDSILELLSDKVIRSEETVSG